MSATKRDGTMPNQTLSKDDSLLVLRLAVGKLMDSGLVVGAKNHERGLILTIEGAQVVYDGGKANFVQQSKPAYVVNTVYPIEVPADTMGVPAVPAVPAKNGKVPARVPAKAKKVPAKDKVPADYQTRIFLPE